MKGRRVEIKPDVEVQVIKHPRNIDYLASEMSWEYGCAIQTVHTLFNKTVELIVSLGTDFRHRREAGSVMHVTRPDAVLHCKQVSRGRIKLLKGAMTPTEMTLRKKVVVSYQEAAARYAYCVENNTHIYMPPTIGEIPSGEPDPN